MFTLRGHHLICLVAFQGEGYSEEFTRNFRKLQKIYLHRPEEKIKVIAGPDMACKKCPHLKNNLCTSSSDGPNSKILSLDKKALKLLKIRPGIYKVGDLHQRLRCLAKSTLRSFCRHCSWYPVTKCPEIITSFFS